MDPRFYFERLYPLQDQVLTALRGAATGFYLTAGTAASRGYLHHRFSDDLDFFVNDDPSFGLWSARVVNTLRSVAGLDTQMVQRDERFVRLQVTAEDVTFMIELVNDVPARVGDVRDHPVLGRLDSPENILANKVSAVLDRREPKDLADIWGFCCRLNLPIAAAVGNAQSKAAGVFPADLARALLTATTEDWQLIRWIQAPLLDEFIAGLRRLGELLLLLPPSGENG